MILEAAHEYARRGWRVLPIHGVLADGSCTCSKPELHKDGKGIAKHPTVGRWQKLASTSGADIQEWFDVMGPRNVGIATGSESGIFVLDIDPAAGGDESLTALLAPHGWLPLTRVVKTGSGGTHYYFRWPGHDVRNSVGALGKGIDIRGEGGQVVAPPSRAPGGSYEVAEDFEVADAPAWLLELVKPKEPAPRPVADPAPPRSDSAVAAYVRRVLDLEVEALAKMEADSGRNHGLNRSAFVLGTIGAHPDSGLVRDVVYLALEAACTANGLIADDGQDQFDASFNSGWNAGLEHPREWPPPSTRGGVTVLPFDDSGALPDPSIYFADKAAGVDVAALSATVLSLGPLAWGRDGAPWSYRGGVWRPDPDAVTARCVRALGPRYRGGIAANVSDVVQHSVPRIDSEPVPTMINFRNGMLDWATGDLTPHAPELLSTVQLGTDWDPSATCPGFEAFLGSILHPDLIELAWEMIGYLMYSGNPLQVAFMFVGSGQNGKGTLLRVIEALLGKENVCSESLDSLNTNRFAAYSLFGKIANIAGDIDATYQQSTAAFKKLTGEDVYAAEKKFGDRFVFTSWAVPVFSANKIPGSADTSVGYLRRWVVLNFPNSFENAPVRGLSTRLVEELPGVAARALPALRNLLARGGFDLTGEALAAKEEFAEAIDQVRQWITDATLVAPEHFEPRAGLYDSYRIWGERNGVGRLKSSEFYHRLDSIGYRPLKVQGIRGYKGIIAQEKAGAILGSAVGAGVLD